MDEREKVEVDIAKMQLSESGPSNEDPARPETPTAPRLHAAEIGINFETRLTREVNFQGQSRTLVGFADYTLGYDDKASGSGNLVVLEAKKRYHVTRAYGQLLAYMGTL